MITYGKVTCSTFNPSIFFIQIVYKKKTHQTLLCLKVEVYYKIATITEPR